jgi:hypothetical protein
LPRATPFGFFLPPRGVYSGFNILDSKFFFHIIARLEPSPPTPVRNRRRVRRFVFVAIAALLLPAVLLIVLFPSESQVTWLTLAELAHATKPGPLTIIKHKLINLTAPLWRWYHSNRRSIYISSNFLILSTAAAEQTGLGAPTTTNADGLRAWILSPAELDAFRQRLKTLPGASNSFAPAFQTADGSPAQLSMNPPIGCSINVLPRAASHSVKLLLNATSAEIADLTATNITIKTNFAATCAAVVPNNGGLVLDGGKPDGTNSQSYWLILCPTMLDSQGNRIKP